MTPNAVKKHECLAENELHNLDYSTIKNDYKNVDDVEVKPAMASTSEGGTLDQAPENSHEELDEPNDNIGPFVAVRSLLLGVYDILEEQAENGPFTYGVSTGLSDLDAITGGLQKGNLIIVAGGAGMAKSTLCQNIARRASKRKDVTVAYFSLEATSKQVVQRLLAADAEVDSLRLLTGRMNEDEWGEVAKSVQNFYTSYLLMDDRMHKSVNDIWVACDELLKVSEVGLVIIDSLPLVSDLGGDNIWDAAKMLKLMARHLNVPVIAATHLYSGRTDRRGDKRPMMGDLAGVESHADEVLLLHRSQTAGLGAGFDEPEVLEIIVAKQANGPTGCIHVGFVPQHALVTDLALENQKEPIGF